MQRAPGRRALEVRLSYSFGLGWVEKRREELVADKAYDRKSYQSPPRRRCVGLAVPSGETHGISPGWF